VSKIVIDVNVRNRASLRMMEKLGLQINKRTLSISAFGKLISHRVLKQYPDRSGRLGWVVPASIRAPRPICR